ncbi:MAG: hypothetical protein ACQES9_09875 [Myxococcota bacterium]
MSNFFAKILFRKKTSRLEKLSQALLHLGEGKIRETVKLLNEAKPTRYVEDIGLYYFVKGRLALELMELEKGEIYLNAAWTLGFHKLTLYVSLALAKARLRRFGEAKELLIIAKNLIGEIPDKDAEKDSETMQLLETSQIIQALLELMDDISKGKGKKEVSKLFDKACKKHLHRKTSTKLSRQNWKKLFDATIKNEPELLYQMNESWVAVLGEYYRQKYKGYWEFGLEALDHAVVIKGVAYRPFNILKNFYNGIIEFEQVLKPESDFSMIFFEEEGLQP